MISDENDNTKWKKILQNTIKDFKEKEAQWIKSTYFRKILQQCAVVLGGSRSYEDSRTTYLYGGLDD